MAGKIPTGKSGFCGEHAAAWVLGSVHKKESYFVLRDHIFIFPASAMRLRVNGPTAKERDEMHEEHLKREDMRLKSHHVDAWVQTVQIQPSAKMLKIRGLTQKDWKDHLKSLHFIRDHIPRCLDGEHAVWHDRIDNLMTLAVNKFGVQLTRPLAWNKAYKLAKKWKVTYGSATSRIPFDR